MRSVWPRHEPKSEFELAEAQRSSAANAALSVEFGNPHPDVWAPREICCDCFGVPDQETKKEL